LRTRRNESVYFSRTGNELSLSGAAAAKLLRAIIQRGKPFKFKASGWSMSPFIRDKDIITLSPCSTAFPQKGDVVGVMDPDTGKLVVHRIVGMNNGRYWIKGDNAKNKEPGSFGRDRLCGHVTRVERDGKPVWFGAGFEKRAIAVLSQVPFVMRMVSKALGLIRRIEAINHRPLVPFLRGFARGTPVRSAGPTLVKYATLSFGIKRGTAGQAEGAESNNFSIAVDPAWCGTGTTAMKNTQQLTL